MKYFLLLTAILVALLLHFGCKTSTVLKSNPPPTTRGR